MDDSFLGGVLIGIGAATLLIATGYYAGFTSIIKTTLFDPKNVEFKWKLQWLTAILIVGSIISMQKKIAVVFNTPKLIVGCGLIGFGATLCHGCTSGHGLMGLSRFSFRSLIAVFTFFTTAIITATLSPQLKTSHQSCWTERSGVLISTLLALNFLLLTIPQTGETKFWWVSPCIASVCAVIFSIGLYISGMYDPIVVNKTLKINHSHWHPGLLITFITALFVITILTYIKPLQPLICKFINDRNFESICQYMTSDSSEIDFKLVFGAAIFGIGWGATGICPSTLPLRIGMGDHGLAMGIPSFVVGVKAAMITDRFQYIHNLSEECIFYRFFDDLSSTFTYIVGDLITKEIVLIDTVSGTNNKTIPTHKFFNNIWYCDQDITKQYALDLFIKENKFHLTAVINTHLHVDHISANQHLKSSFLVESHLPFYEAAKMDVVITEKYTLNLTNLKIKAIHTPGHTSNCHSLLVYLNNKSGVHICFTGDTLLNESVGRTDLNVNENAITRAQRRRELFESIQKIKENVNNDTIIAPCHAYGNTKMLSMKEVMKINKFLSMNFENFEKDLLQREESLKEFDAKDLEFCTNCNLLCGAIPGSQIKSLLRLESKSTGSCG
tara:strand:+ start:841 stop:2676 length:1836 start_codon:yes stop_codon:yes gene_type:complete